MRVVAIDDFGTGYSSLKPGCPSSPSTASRSTGSLSSRLARRPAEGCTSRRRHHRSCARLRHDDRRRGGVENPGPALEHLARCGCERIPGLICTAIPFPSCNSRSCSSKPRQTAGMAGIPAAARHGDSGLTGPVRAPATTNLMISSSRFRSESCGCVPGTGLVTSNPCWKPATCAQLRCETSCMITNSRLAPAFKRNLDALHSCRDPAAEVLAELLNQHFPCSAAPRPAQCLLRRRRRQVALSIQHVIFQGRGPRIRAARAQRFHPRGAQGGLGRSKLSAARILDDGIEGAEYSPSRRHIATSGTPSRECLLSARGERLGRNRASPTAAAVMTGSRILREAMAAASKLAS